MYQTDLVVSLI